MKSPLSGPLISGHLCHYFLMVVEDLHINVCVSGIKRYILLLKLILFNNRYGALYIDKDIDDHCIFQLFKGESHLCLCECKCALM